ncbi:MAG: tRNA (guanosine(37)-N1)-methyltransferase TrmD [Vampirovibrio sp.]|nr:tRNA (guanosine(37)-N1)-methyltransferase TrmD [Vampirovibrio sp.]
MKFSVLTLFPELIESYTTTSIIGRAVANETIKVDVLNPRDFTTNKHKKVDDTPYGGGAGMVLACQPVVDAYRSLLPLNPKAKVILTSPAGKKFTHELAMEWAEITDQLVILCGHYEGFDHRIFELIPALEEVSVGDFVVTGGELPALLMIDAVSRLVDGCVQAKESVENDSFYNGLLDFPHYTKPAVFEGLAVPTVLLSGNHAEIEKWRKAQALARTQDLRPDLLG